MKRLSSLAAFTISLGICGTAAAQETFSFEGFDMQQFQPAAGSDRFFGIPDADVKGHLEASGSLIGNYGLRPFKLVDRSNDETVATIAQTQFYAHANGALRLWNRVQVGVDVPVAVAQSGDGAAIGSPSGAAVGDMRLSARGAFAKSDPASAAVGVDVWVPTGSQSELTGDGSARVNPKLIFSGRKGNVIYSANGGVLLRKSQMISEASIGNALTFGAGGGVLLAKERLQLGAELYGSAIFPQGEGSMFDGKSTPLEALGGAKLRLRPVVLGIAAGPGLSTAPGTPQFRALASAALVMDDEPKKQEPAPRCGEDGMEPCASAALADADKDGIGDLEDHCPQEPGIKQPGPRNGCPGDVDLDGIADGQDACKEVAGVVSADPAKNGCPADEDGDGIADAKDACVSIAGVASSDPKKNGCPEDGDNDGIANATDACPTEPGDPSKDPKRNGCPALAKLEGKEVKIMQQVHFATGKDTILPDSDQLLQAVADVLKEHPELTKMSIEGHTDDVGADALNKALSKRRAESVKKWLTSRGGIDAARLMAVGWGEEQPLEKAKTEDARARNRRVEFHVVKSSQ